MKRLAWAAIALLLGTGDGKAVTVWQGEAVLETVTSQCEPFDIFVGHIYRTVFRPRNLGDNGPDERLGFFGVRASYAILAAAAPLAGSGSYSAQGLGSTVNFIDINQPIAGDYTFSGFVKVPAVPAVGTSVVQVRGTINNFFSIVGCSVTFRSHLVKRPA